MDLNQLASDLLMDTKGSASPSLTAIDWQTGSLAAFLPEIILCVTIVLVLLIRVFDLGVWLDRRLSRWNLGGTAFLLTLAGSAVAFYFACLPLLGDSIVRREIFTGMLVYDAFAVYIRSLLLLFLVLFTVFTWLSGIPDAEDGPDIYSLVIGATLGMCLMATANHLLMIFMAVEMASVPSYALAGMLKGRRKASEAALKYSIYGAGAAGVMLYGISLLAGLLNTAHLPTLAYELAVRLPDMAGQEWMVLTVATLMVMVGVAFKLSAFPFHFWCPDVFEGASAEVNAFLSVASKAAALALLIRVALGFSTLPGAPVASVEPPEVAPVVASADAAQDLFVAAVVDDPAAEEAPVEEAPAEEAPVEEAPVEEAPVEGAEGEESPGAAAGELLPDELLEDAEEPAVAIVVSPGLTRSEAMTNLAPVRYFLSTLIAWLAIVTCTFGNLAAYGQTNIKRLLAYSTIAHAGYMMMAVPPVLALAQTNPESAELGIAGLAVYLGVYLFMNLGAFAVVAFLRNEMRSEEIADYGGLIRHCPITVICLSLMLFSLVGLPPLSGFIGKFAIFASLAEGFRLTDHFYLILLLVIGGLNTAISLFYYLNVVRVMTMSPEPETRTPFSLHWFSTAFILLITVPTAFLLLGWGELHRIATLASDLLGKL